MRKSRGFIALLPKNVREQISRKISDGWQYKTVANWLFTQTVQQDIPDLNLKTGESYSQIWTRNGTHAAGIHRCKNHLAAWFQGGYREWLSEEADKEESVRLVDHVENLTSATSDRGQPGSTTGGTLLIRSLLLDAINKIRKGNNSPEDLARLATAWTRVNEGGHRVQGSIDLGLRSLRDEIKTNPEALEAFNKLRGAVKKSTKRS